MCNLVILNISMGLYNIRKYDDYLEIEGKVTLVWFKTNTCMLECGVPQGLHLIILVIFTVLYMYVKETNKIILKTSAEYILKDALNNVL